MRLHDILRTQLGLSDADFAARCGLLRSDVHAYRTGRRVPRADTAARILAALRELGVELSLDDLLRRPAARRRRRTAA